MIITANVFDDIVQFLENLWEMAQQVWNWLEYIFTHFGISIVLDLAFAAVGKALDFIAYGAGRLGATGVQDGMTTASDTLQSQTVTDIFAIGGWMLDWIVPIEFLDPAIGVLLLAWMISFTVRHCFFIYHQFWGSN